MNRNSTNVYVVGAVENPNSRIVRIVHISETMGCEDIMIPTHDTAASVNPFDNTTTSTSSNIKIPFGHILIHSGDFGKKTDFITSNLWRSRIIAGQIDRMNKFFSKLPHPNKLYIPCGQNDNLLTKWNDNSFLIRDLLADSVTYLDGETIDLYSLKIHATPCSNSSKAKLRNNLKTSNHNNSDITYGLSDSWLNVPDDTDIIVSQDNPWNYFIFNNVIQKIKPMLHLYGKNHGHYGVTFKDGVVFSNASYHSFVKLKKRQYQLLQKTTNSSSSSSRYRNYHYYHTPNYYNTYNQQHYNSTTTTANTTSTTQYIGDYYHNSNSLTLASTINEHMNHHRQNNLLLDCLPCWFPRQFNNNSNSSSHNNDDRSGWSSTHTPPPPPPLLWHTGDLYEPLVFDVYVPPRSTSSSSSTKDKLKKNKEHVDDEEVEDDEEEDDDDDENGDKNNKRSYINSISSLSSTCSLPIRRIMK